MSKNIQKIVSVTTSIATMAVMSGIGMLAPLAVSAATINEGDTIREASNPDVYIVKYVGSKKFKRLILNPQVFESYGHLSWNNIKIVSQAEMDSFTTSELVRALGDTKVYKLIPNGDIGTKQWMNMSAEAFTAAGNDWDSIYVINNTDRDNYTAGSDLTGSGSTPIVGGDLSVSLASNTPAAGVAVEGGARIPFTKVNITAGSSGATITGLTVQRTGLSDDLAFSSLVLIDDSDNIQVGLSQTLNASHQVTFSEAITISANTTKTYTLAGNMAASLDSYNGQLAALSLVAVTTTASVSASLPITGNSQTLNSTLTIGTATITAGSTDPGSAATKNIGTTGYTFSSLKVTAGSAEEVTVYSIKWNQSDSAAASDLANVVVSDGATNYATTVSSDGKYYTANFGSAGVVIGKGLNKDFSIKGDILNGSARTISFDIYRNTDIAVKGNTYGYYMTPTFTDNGITHATAQATDINNTTAPYFAGARVTVGGGSLRIDKNASIAPAANITEGATSQILGGFDFVVQGEPVNVSSIRLDFDNVGTGSTSDVTSITLNKTDGTVLSTGGTAADDTTSFETTLEGTVNGHVSFSGSITFPVGTTQVVVKGNLNTDFAAGDTFRTGFSTPDARITSIIGGTTGNTITATPATAIWSNTMTIKGGSLTATIGTTPVNQTVISGKSDFTFSNIVLDAGASGENVKVTQIILSNTYSASTDVYSVRLYDGSTQLTTGSNVVTPSTSASAALNTFTLDSPLVIAKGTAKTISVVGNILATAAATHVENWGFTAATTNVTATGVSTGQAITVTTTADAGPTATIAAAGQYSWALDSSTPTGKLIAAKSTGNVMTILRFKATSEQINVEKMMVGLTSASSSGRDIKAFYIYDGSTLLGQGVFPNLNGGLSGNTASTTVTLSTPLQIPANTEKLVTIKADIDDINTTATVATAGHRVALDIISRDTVFVETTNNQGVGASSGTTITGYGTANASSTAQTTAYIYKSVPTVAKVDLTSTTLGSGGTYDLYRFSVTADANGDIDLYKFSFKIATTDGTSGHLALTNLTLVDVTESSEVTLYASTTNFYDTWTNGFGDDTIDVVLLASPGTPGTSAVAQRTVSAGTTKTFVLKGDLSGVITGAGRSVQLESDAETTYKGATTYGETAANVDNDPSLDDDFIWSDWSDADHSTDADGSAATDWYNGYLVAGLPSSNLSANNFSK